MTVEIDLDDCGGLNLAEWLRNEEVGTFQRDVEEKIARFLFHGDPEDMQFAQAVQILAWVGCSAGERAALQRDIVALNGLGDGVLIPCGFGKSLWKTTCKVGQFIADHKTAILIGAALCATGAGLAIAAGYTCSVAAGGVVVAGAGAVFTKEEVPKRDIPRAPPSSKEEIALAGQSIFPSLPKLELPSSNTELFVTADGIWANGQFFSNQELMQRSLLAKEAFGVDLCNQGSWSEQLNDSLMPSLQAKDVDLQTLSDLAVDADRWIGNKVAEFEPSAVMSIYEPQPVRSKTFTLDGKQRDGCHISWINGIDNTLLESKASASYIQTLSGGLTVSGIYNCTHGPIVDVLEAALLNHQGCSPNTAQLLQNEWSKFHEANKDRPNARLLQICHSQGAIDVKNALIQSPLEIRERVIVVAIAPAAVVPNRLCFRTYNYASEKDFVYKLEPAPPRPIVSMTLDDVILATFGELIDDRGELIILKPHPDAKGIDHGAQSPTYKEPLEKIIANYLYNQGECLSAENGQLQ